MDETRASSAVAATVVIPLGSPEPALERQVRAVLAQSCSDPFDVVLSVNTDDPTVLAFVDFVVEAVSDSRLHAVDASARRGAAHARNVGARSTTAPTLAFCDADDLVHQGWLHALLDGLRVYDAVSGRVVDTFAEPRMAAWHPPATPGRLPTFMGVPYLLSGNLAIRRDAFEAVGGFDETLTRCEDIALGWALQQHGYTIGFAAEAVIDYRHRAGLRTMLRQHYYYGRGMSEVLRRYDGFGGQPGAAGRVRLLTPNGQRVDKRTLVGFIRRGAIALGRARGLVGAGPAADAATPISQETG